MAEVIRVVDIRGIESLNSLLLKFTNDVKNLDGFGTKVGKLIVDSASAMAPKRSGALAASIGTVSRKEGVQVYAGSERVPYAGVIEYGWAARGRQPQPYLMPAVQEKIGMVVEKYEEGISGTIRKYNLD